VRAGFLAIGYVLLAGLSLATIRMAGLSHRCLQLAGPDLKKTTSCCQHGVVRLAASVSSAVAFMSEARFARASVI